MNLIIAPFANQHIGAFISPKPICSIRADDVGNTFEIIDIGRLVGEATDKAAIEEHPNTTARIRRIIQGVDTVPSLESLIAPPDKEIGVWTADQFVSAGLTVEVIVARQVV